MKLQWTKIRNTWVAGAAGEFTIRKLDGFSGGSCYKVRRAGKVIADGLSTLREAKEFAQDMEIES